MRPGAKVTQPHTRPGPKTGRHYGELYCAIRATAAQKRAFSWRDIGVPHDAALLRAALSSMKATGELKRVKPGTLGCKAEPALYAAAANGKDRK